MAEDQTSGTPVETPTPPAESVTPPADNGGAVNRADHERALRDLHRFKEESRQAQEKLKEAETNRLKEQQNWKTLYEQTLEEKKKLEGQVKFMTEGQINSLKMSSLKNEAARLGLLDSAMEDLEMLDLSDLIVETTNNGKARVVNAQTYAEMLKSKKPHWFGSKAAPQVNTSSPSIVNGPVTQKTILELQTEFSKNPTPENQKKLKDAILKFKASVPQVAATGRGV